MRTTLIMEIEHSKPIPDLTDIAANRVWPLDGVTGVTAAIQDDASIAKMDVSERGFQDGKEKFWAWLWRSQT